jgi:hypothetical protein
LPWFGLDETNRRQVEAELLVRLAEGEPPGMRLVLRLRHGKAQIEGGAEPSCGVDVIGMLPAAGQPHRPRAGELQRPVAPVAQ